MIQVQEIFGTFFISTHHSSTITYTHPFVNRSGPWGLEPRDWTSDGYIPEEPNEFSKKAWVLLAWVLISLNWEAFFRSGFPHFVKLANIEIPILHDGFI